MTGITGAKIQSCLQPGELQKLSNFFRVTVFHWILCCRASSSKPSKMHWVWALRLKPTVFPPSCIWAVFNVSRNTKTSHFVGYPSVWPAVCYKPYKVHCNHVLESVNNSCSVLQKAFWLAFPRRWSSQWPLVTTPWRAGTLCSSATRMPCPSCTTLRARQWSTPTLGVSQEVKMNNL